MVDQCMATTVCSEQFNSGVTSLLSVEEKIVKLMTATEVSTETVAPGKVTSKAFSFIVITV